MTQPVPPQFADALVAQDETDHVADRPSTDALKQELQTMMTRTLSQTHRNLGYVLAFVLVLGGGLMGSLAISESLPPLAAAGLLFGVGCSFLWAWKIFRMALVGEIDLRKDNHQIANMVWFFTIIMAVLMLMAAGFKEDLSNRKLILITGQALLFLIAAATYLITQRMEEAELNSRERLLQMQLRLEELASR